MMYEAEIPTLTVCIPTLTTLAGIETSEKKAPGPPGRLRRTMKPSMRRWKPSETCAVEKANISVAMPTSSLLILGVRRRMVSMVRQDQKRTKFIPARARREHRRKTTGNGVLTVEKRLEPDSGQVRFVKRDAWASHGSGNAVG